MNHLMETLKNHVSSVGVVVVNHGVFERFEEVFLELEIGEFLLFEETHSELTKRVESEEGNLRVGVTGDLGADRLSVKSYGIKGAMKREHTWLKCSPMIVHMFDHSRRIRFML